MLQPRYVNVLTCYSMLLLIVILFQIGPVPLKAIIFIFWDDFSCQIVVLFGLKYIFLFVDYFRICNEHLKSANNRIFNLILCDIFIPML